MKKAAIIFFSVCFALLVANSITPHAFAKTASSLQTLPTNCDVTLIRLHGINSYDTKCLIAHRKASGKITPFTSLVDCNYPGGTINADFFWYHSDQDHGFYCFTGTGYIGFNPIGPV